MKILMTKQIKHVSGGTFAGPGIKPDAFIPKPSTPPKPPIYVTPDKPKPHTPPKPKK